MQCYMYLNMYLNKYVSWPEEIKHMILFFIWLYQNSSYVKEKCKTISIEYGICLFLLTVGGQLSIANISGTTTDSLLGFTHSLSGNSSHSTVTQSFPSQQTFFNNTALPEHIECDTNKACCLQVPYHGDKDLP